MTALRSAFLIAAAALAAMSAYAQNKPIAYPAKGQSQNQQAQDDGQCYGWARSSTGVDPAAMSGGAPQQTGPAVGGGQRARGAAGGAIIGGILGGGSGAAKGAAIGGAGGTGVVLATKGKEVRLGPGAAITTRLTAPLTVRMKT